MSAPEESAIDLALLGHPESYEHFGDLVLRERPEYGSHRLERYRATLERFFEWTPSYVSGQPFSVRSPRGACVTGSLVVCPFLPDTAQSVAGIARAAAKTRQGCEVARSRGARIVALGGLTSVVLGARSGAVARDVGLAVTSGNALTAALALEQLDAAIRWLDWDLSERTVAVVGASGNIGRACVSALACRVRALVLIGRSAPKLEALRHSLEARSASVHVSTLAADAVRASVIVTATSAGRPLLQASALRPGTLVCDIGYPKTVDGDIDRGDVLVFRAGLAEMPFDLPLTHYTRLPSRRLMFGCFSEAMVLALGGRYESFSDYDTGITPEKLTDVLALAREHGFSPAPLFSGDTRVDERRVERLCAAERSLR